MIFVAYDPKAPLAVARSVKIPSSNAKENPVHGLPCLLDENIAERTSVVGGNLK